MENDLTDLIDTKINKNIFLWNYYCARIKIGKRVSSISIYLSKLKLLVTYFIIFKTDPLTNKSPTLVIIKVGKKGVTSNNNTNTNKF